MEARQNYQRLKMKLVDYGHSDLLCVTSSIDRDENTLNDKYERMNSRDLDLLIKQERAKGYEMTCFNFSKPAFQGHIDLICPPFSSSAGSYNWKNLWNYWLANYDTTPSNPIEANIKMNDLMGKEYVVDWSEFADYKC